MNLPYFNDMFVKNISNSEDIVLNIYEDTAGEIYFSIPNVCSATHGSPEKEIEAITNYGFGEYIMYKNNIAYLPFKYSLGWLTNIKSDRIDKIVEVNNIAHYFWGERVKRIVEMKRELGEIS